MMVMTMMKRVMVMMTSVTVIIMMTMMIRVMAMMTLVTVIITQVLYEVTASGVYTSCTVIAILLILG